MHCGYHFRPDLRVKAQEDLMRNPVLFYAVVEALECADVGENGEAIIPIAQAHKLSELVGHNWHSPEEWERLFGTTRVADEM